MNTQLQQWNILATIGRVFLAFLTAVGHLVLFTLTALRHAVHRPIFLRNIFQQMLRIGYFSLPVVGLTAIFTGAVLALQIYVGGSRFNAESFVGQVVVIAMVRELGPVLAALMVAGRVSSAIAAEIGTMRVTEQIDALTTLATNPFKYLVVPRLIAATLTLPLLVLVADSIGVMGGYLAATQRLGLNAGAYMRATIDVLEWEDVTSGLTKAAVFGFLIALMGCYHGYNSRGGAQGVGAATTDAVVSASVLILLFNYILTDFFFS